MPPVYRKYLLSYKNSIAFIEIYLCLTPEKLPLFVRTTKVNYYLHCFRYAKLVDNTIAVVVDA